ncbi:hypothetical protein KY326_02525 [Candidatus Woesearchaeota archaeon]|nr:hypothetical protein [Candidatus Woesearchaeota archaeon]
MKTDRDYECKLTRIDYFDLQYAARLEELEGDNDDSKSTITIEWLIKEFHTDDFLERCGRKFGIKPEHIIARIREHTRECSSCEIIYSRAYKEAIKDKQWIKKEFKKAEMRKKQLERVSKTHKDR